MSPFLSHLVCAEENALLAELRSRGERMRYEPRLREPTRAAGGGCPSRGRCSNTGAAVASF